jgi:MAC/Perforin domain
LNPKTTEGVFNGDNPALPYGVSFEEVDAGSDDAHTEDVTSISNTVRSWSVTTGLNAGIGKMLSASLSTAVHDSVQEQLKRRSRFTVSRSTAVKYVATMNVPELQLQEQFVTAIHSRLKELQADWKNFIATFGTHYVHAMTLGSIKPVFPG